MKVFVTGSESFIGRALRARCRELGIEFIGVDSAGEGALKADIRDPALADLIPEGAAVLHLAAISRDPDCRADPRNAFDVNVNGTINVAAAAQRRKASQLVFASSEWIYGDVRNDEIQREDQPIDVTAMKSVYAFTKIVGEQCLRMMCALPGVTVLRFAIVYCPRPTNWSAVENLFDSVRTRDVVTIGAAATARRFIHVDDIVSGILASLDRKGFEIFNLSGDRPITLGEIVAASSRLLGRKVELVESNPTQPSVRNPDNARARANLDWRPAIDLKAGLRSLSHFMAQAG
jgi:nucleoside-diphosphate-sugar epimerase